jgi:hypothetical protein
VKQLVERPASIEVSELGRLLSSSL